MITGYYSGQIYCKAATHDAHHFLHLI